MKHLTLTIDDLIMLGACETQLQRFQKFFPSGVAISQSGMRKLLEAYDDEAEGIQYDLAHVEDHRFQVTWCFLQKPGYSNSEYAHLLRYAYETKIGSKEYYDTFLKLFKLAKPNIVKFLKYQRARHYKED